MSDDLKQAAATPATDARESASAAAVPPDEPTTIASALDVGGAVGALTRAALDEGLAGLPREDVLTAALELLGFDTRRMDSRAIAIAAIRKIADWPDLGDQRHHTDRFIRHVLQLRLDQKRSKS